jgi:hypothetical protein
MEVDTEKNMFYRMRREYLTETSSLEPPFEFKSRRQALKSDSVEEENEIDEVEVKETQKSTRRRSQFRAKIKNSLFDSSLLKANHEDWTQELLAGIPQKFY